MRLLQAVRMLAKSTATKLIRHNIGNLKTVFSHAQIVGVFFFCHFAHFIFYLDIWSSHFLTLSVAEHGNSSACQVCGQLDN